MPSSRWATGSPSATASSRSTVASTAIFVGFHGHLEALIPLFAVGVFVAVTLSQTGMVAHWLRARSHSWRRSLAVNALGAVLTASVVLVAAVSKFAEGAWVVVIGIPVLVWLSLRVRARYRAVHEALAVQPLPDVDPDTNLGGAPHDPAAGTGDRRHESPEQIRHLLLVAVERLDRANLRALAYAASLGQPLLAVHLSPDEEQARRFRREWRTWDVPLRHELVLSPYRAIVAPLAHYVEALQAQRPDVTTTVILAELVFERPSQRLLQSQVAPRLRFALRSEPNVVVATVPFHVRA